MGKSTKSVVHVKKKKKSFDRKRTLHCNHDKPLRNIEELNEVVRGHKIQRSSEKGNWKVIPRDSCEIYKERKKRQIDNEGTQNNNAGDAEEVDDSDKKDKGEEDTTSVEKKKRENNRKSKKKSGKERNRKARQKSCSSTSSYISTSASTSCTSVSGMEYD